MFDFTKEVVINSRNFEASEGLRGKKFRVHGGGDYFLENIVDKKVYKTAPQVGSLAILKLDADAIVNKLVSDQKHFTLKIELGLDKDARLDWASAVYMFKKPMLVDAFAANWTDNQAELAKLLKAVLTDYKFVYVLHGADDKAVALELGIMEDQYDASKVYVVGSDYNIKVSKVSVYEYVCDARCEGSSEEPSVVFSANPRMGSEDGLFEYSPNVVEFGTYNYLLHNLRMPTYENYRYTSPAEVEMPVAGASYVQFTFLYCVPRPGLGGMSVAGQFNHSTTTHVFYVEQSLANDFAAMFDEGMVSDVQLSDNGASSYEVNILPDSSATSGSVTE